MEGGTKMGYEGAIMVPILVLASAGILYYGLIAVRERKTDLSDE